MNLSKQQILWIGSIAVIGGIGGIAADMFSAWNNAPGMETAISVDQASMKAIFATKPRWTYVVGTYLGVFFIPLHMFGFFLAYLALRPAGQLRAVLFTIAAFYLVAIGGGFHGTLAFLGDVIQSNDAELLARVYPYWQNWGLVMIAGYLLISVYLFFVMVSGKTMYDRRAAVFSPMPLMILSSLLIAVLPDSLNGAKAFLSATGLNLPLLIFHIVSIRTLLTVLRKTPGKILA
ncbi:MAG: DUF6796 family protein [Acidiferrobacterales bacterium]